MTFAEMVFFWLVGSIMLLLINTLCFARRIEGLEKDNARYMGLVAQHPQLFYSADLEPTGGDK